MDLAKQIKQRPTVVIAKTTKGKGVSFMEGKAQWHGKSPNDEEYNIAMNELREKEHSILEMQKKDSEGGI